MAKNKAAKIQSWGTYVYKNSRYKEISSSNVQLRGYTDEEYAFIPLLSNIKSGILDKMTKSSINGYDCYQIEEDINSNSVLDFGDNEITFIQCDRNQGDKNIGLFTPNIDSTTYADASATDILYDPDGYGICFPFLKDNSSSALTYSGFVGAITQWSSGTVFSYNNGEMVKPYDFFPRRYSGNNKKSLSAKYYSDIDAFLVPCSFSMPRVTKEYGKSSTYPDGENCYFGNNISKPNIGSFGICLPQRYKTNYYSEYGFELKVTDNSAYNGLCKIKYPGPYYDANQRTIGGITKDNEHYQLVFPTTFLPTHVPYSYAILYDDTNDQFCMLYIYGRRDSNLRIKVGTAVFPFNVLRIEQYSVNAVPSSVDLNDHIASLLGTLIDSDKVPKPDDELFNDNGPDINGAGDPYNTDEFNNVGSSVGGDADPGKDLNSVDATPNTAFDSFMQDTGFFGSYVLSNSDLVKYTKTLSMLYSNASNPIWGEAAGLQADHIVKNTIGLHMLPITIPPTDYASTIFSMGTVGISESGKFLSYSTGNDYANANYLKKLTKTFNVPLGKIKHNYDNFLDFAPYSSASLYIPYIGKVELPINLIQSTSEEERLLRLEFRVNYSSGDFMAILFCNIKGVEVAVSHWNGNCARNVKVSVDDDSSAVIAGANRIASMFSASMSLTSGSNNFGGTLTGNNNNVRNNYYENKQMNSNMNLDQTTSGKTGGITFSTPSAPSTVTTNQHMIGNGSANGELGYLGIQDIVLTVERPVWWKPYDYGNLVGYPTKKVAKLSSVKGFAKISDAHIRCYATASEKEEIASLLAEGVIF